MTNSVQWINIDPENLLNAPCEPLRAVVAWVMFRAVSVLLKMTSELEEMISSLNIILQTVIRAGMANSLHPTVSRLFNETMNATFEELPKLHSLKVHPDSLIRFMDSETVKFKDVRLFNARLGTLKDAFRNLYPNVQSVKLSDL